jgi:hypothetical protein
VLDCAPSTIDWMTEAIKMNYIVRAVLYPVVSQ